jgi:hypothetical protein
MVAPFERLKGERRRSGDALAVPAPRGGLATNGGVREGFSEALQVEVSVPLGGEAFMLSVQAGKGDIAPIDEGAGELLHADVIVAPVLCEAKDYVNRAHFGLRKPCIHAVGSLARINIVLDSSRADKHSAGEDHARDIEEGVVRRVRGGL